MNYIYTEGGTQSSCWSVFFGNYLKNIVYEGAEDTCLYFGLETLNRIDLDELLKKNKKIFF